MAKHYSIIKEKYNHCTVKEKQLNGFKVNPKNRVKYDGIMVDELVLINPSFIEKVLKKKIKRKLDLYLNLIIAALDDGSDGETIRNALNELSRYKDIVKYKYQKYLDEKYISLLLQKISILEYELKQKLIYVTNKTEEKRNGKSR